MHPLKWGVNLYGQPDRKIPVFFTPSFSFVRSFSYLGSSFPFACTWGQWRTMGTYLKTVAFVRGRVAFWLKMTLKTPTSTTPPPLCYPHPTSWLCAVLILKLWRFTLFAHKSNKLLTAARASQGNIRGSAFTAIIRYMSLIIEINSRKIIPMYAGCYVNDAAVEIIILVWWWEPPPLHWGQTYMRPSISANQFKWVDKEFEIWNPLLRRDQCLIGKKLTNSNELNREKLNRREKQLSFLWCLMVCDLINSGI